MSNEDWPTKIVGPLGQLQAGINLILELGQESADTDTEMDKERISNIVFKMVMDLYAVGKAIDPNHGGGANMTRWCEGFDSILKGMYRPEANCPDFIKEKMEYLVADMKSFR